MDWEKIQIEANNDFKKIKRNVLIVIIMFIIFFSLLIKENLPGGNGYATRNTAIYSAFFDQEMTNIFNDYEKYNFRRSGKPKMSLTYFFEINPNKLSIETLDDLDLSIQGKGWFKKSDIAGNDEDFILMYCKNKAVLGIRAPKNISQSYLATDNWIVFFIFNKNTALNECNDIQ